MIINLRGEEQKPKPLNRKPGPTFAFVNIGLAIATVLPAKATVLNYIQKYSMPLFNSHLYF